MGEDSVVAARHCFQPFLTLAVLAVLAVLSVLAVLAVLSVLAVLAVLSVLSVLSVPSVLPVVLFGSDPPSIIRLKYHSIASFSSIPFFQCFQLIAVPFPTRSYGVLLRRLA